MSYTDVRKSSFQPGIKWDTTQSLFEEAIAILKVYVLNYRASKYIRKN